MPARKSPAKGSKRARASIFADAPDGPDRPRLLMAAYIRVSRVKGRQGDSFTSPAVQSDDCVSEAKRIGAEVAFVIKDLDVSGGDWDREDLERAIQLIEAGQLDGLICPRIDRLGRGVSGLLDTVDRISAAGGRLVLVEERIDLDSWQGRLMFQILAAFAESVLNMHIENSRRLQERNCNDGVAGRVPYGYLKRTQAETVDGRTYRAGTLIAHPDQARFVQEMFRLAAANHSDREIRDALAADGAWGDETPPEPPSIRVLLKNRKFLGEIRAGEHVNLDAHEALVSETMFQAAAARTPRRTSAPRRDEDEFLLTGILRCFSCRYALARRRSYPGPRGRPEPDCYHCPGGGCPAGASMYRHLIEPYVAERFKAWWGEQLTVFAEISGDTDALAEAQHAFDAALAAQERFAEDIEYQEQMGREASMKTGARHLQRVEEARTRLRRLTSAVPGLGTQDLLTDFDDLPVPDRRRLIGAAFGAVFLRPSHSGSTGPRGYATAAERAVVVLRGDLAEIDLPRPGRRGFERRPLTDDEVARLALGG